jgi:hypothetical protein
MPTTTTVRWFPQGLNAAILRGFEGSLARVAADANATSPAKEAGAAIRQTGPTQAELTPTGIGAIMEEGAKPHVIEPKKGYLYLKGQNVFVSVEVHHPGSPAKPYLGPAARRWAQGGFQSTAKVSLAASGYR